MFIKFAYNLYQFFISFILGVLNVLPESEFYNKIRGSFVSKLVSECGGNLQISKGVHILSPKNIKLGANVFIGYNTWINGYGGLTVGNDVMFGPFCAISTANHTDSGAGFRWGPHASDSVEIGSGVWLAAHVIVLPGAKIDDKCLLAAGAVVKGSISHGLYCGPLAVKKK